MVAKGDMVNYRGRQAKVLSHPDARGMVRLHLGEGQIIEQTNLYQEIAAAEPPPEEEPTPPQRRPSKPKPAGRQGTGRSK